MPAGGGRDSPFAACRPPVTGVLGVMGNGNAHFPDAVMASDDDGVLLLDCKVSQQVVASYMQEIVAAATGVR